MQISSTLNCRRKHRGVQRYSTCVQCYNVHMRDIMSTYGCVEGGGHFSPSGTLFTSEFCPEDIIHGGIKINSDKGIRQRTP